MEPSARPKPTISQTFSGPTMGSRNHFGSPTTPSAPKPSYLKNTVSNDTAPELVKPKDLKSRFENANEVKPPFPKPIKPKPPDVNKDSETKPVFPKPPLQKPGGVPEAKPVFPKPSTLAKPCTKFEPKNESTALTSAGTNSTTPKLPYSVKPKSTFSALKQQPGETKEESPASGSASGTISGTTTSSVSGFGTKQTSFRAAQNLFSKAEEAAKDDQKSQSGKESPRTIPKKPSYKGKPAPPEDPATPKKNPLPNHLALGSAPSKPNRPPRVNIEKFRKSRETSSDGKFD